MLSRVPPPRRLVPQPREPHQNGQTAPARSRPWHLRFRASYKLQSSQHDPTPSLPKHRQHRDQNAKALRTRIETPGSAIAQSRPQNLLPRHQSSSIIPHNPISRTPVSLNSRTVLCQLLPLPRDRSNPLPPLNKIRLCKSRVPRPPGNPVSQPRKKSSKLHRLRNPNPRHRPGNSNNRSGQLRRKGSNGLPKYKISNRRRNYPLNRDPLLFNNRSPPQCSKHRPNNAAPLPRKPSQ